MEKVRCCSFNHVWADIHGSYAIVVCDYCKLEKGVNTKKDHDDWFVEHNHQNLACPDDKKG